MRILTVLVLAAVTGSTIGPGRAQAQDTSGELEGLKPHEVVEQVLGLRTQLALTDEQTAKLTELHVTVRDERHQYSHNGGKPAHAARHQQMITRSQAYADAMAILTPEQRGDAVALLTTLPETIKLPVRLTSMKPHEVVERILAQRKRLGLSDAQAGQLQELHVTIRDEKHVYSHDGSKPHNTRHRTMITRQQAFADAMAVLSPEQRLGAIGLIDAGLKN